MNRFGGLRWILLISTVLLASHAFADVFYSASIAPPPVPVVEQPPCPGDGYIWTPGYYMYGDYGYSWVPGQWVFAPSPGLLWTPGYWGWAAGVYVFHAGYWGPHVGFYGGVNYGHGYFGSGFAGGRWVGNTFHYNAAVSNVGMVSNTYVDRSGIRGYNLGGASARANVQAHRQAAASRNVASASNHRVNSAGGASARAAARAPGQTPPVPAAHAARAQTGQAASHEGSAHSSAASHPAAHAAVRR